MFSGAVLSNNYISFSFTFGFIDKVFNIAGQPIWDPAAHSLVLRTFISYPYRQVVYDTKQNDDEPTMKTTMVFDRGRG